MSAKLSSFRGYYHIGILFNLGRSLYLGLCYIRVPGEKMFAESVIDYRNTGNQKSVLTIFYP